jgi:hypothetical protein
MGNHHAISSFVLLLRDNVRGYLSEEAEDMIDPVAQSFRYQTDYDWHRGQKCVPRWVTRMRSIGAPQRGQG